MKKQFFPIIVITVLGLTIFAGNTFSQTQTTFYKGDRKNTAQALNMPGHLYQKNIDEGLNFLQLGDYDKAKERLWKAVELEPQNPDAYVNLGIVEIGFKNWESAQRILAKAYTLASKNYQKKDLLLYNLGLSYQMAGNYDKAILCYAQALKVADNFGEASFNMGICYDQLGNTEKALINISRARGIFEDRHQIPMIQQADKLLIKTMRTSQKDLTAFAKYLLEKAEEYFNKNETTSAIALARASVIIYPHYADGYYKLGLFYLQAGNTAKANQCFLSALGIKPTFAPAYIEVGKIYESSLKYNLALINYYKALKLDTRNALIHYKIGIIHQKTGRNLKSREWFRKAKVLAIKHNDSALLAEIDSVYKLK